MAQSGWIQRITDGAQLYGEQLPGVPIIELSGDRRVLVEGHKGVTEYSTQAISVRLKFGTVRICGCDLELTRMTAEHLVITGIIESINLQRRCL